MSGIYHVGYFECPQCYCERLYTVYEPPWDPNLGICGACGHQFGYTIDRSPSVVDGQTRLEATVKPVLAPDVLAAGMRRYQAELGEKYLAKYADKGDYARAVKRLHEGLATMDDARRSSLLGRTQGIPGGAGV